MEHQSNSSKTIISFIIIIAVIIGGYFLLRNPKAASTPTDTAPMDDMTMPVPDESMEPVTEMTVEQSFTVEGGNYFFKPDIIEVAKGDTVNITLKNSGGLHDLRIEQYGIATNRIQTGAEETITFVADKVGEFKYFCSVGNHRAQGMEGTLIVK